MSREPIPPDSSGPAACSPRGDTLAGSVAVLLVLMAVQRLVGLGRGISFCRWLEAEQLGQWDMAFSFVMLATPVVVLSLPSAFGRYAEMYRQGGQLRAFLRRMAAFTAVTTSAAALVIWCAASQFSCLIFGSAEHEELVVLVIAALGGTIAYTFATQLFTALRRQTVSSSLHLLNSVLFAILGTLLVLTWQPSTWSVLVAYSASCLCTFLFSLTWIVRTWRAPAQDGPVGHYSFWSRIAPFVVTVWLTDWLTNLFAIADRYMLVHFSGRSITEALNLVGEYHAARFVPLVFVQIAALLATVTMPHLSRDWERGMREAAAARLSLVFKIMSLLLFAAGVATLLGSPLLFHAAFQDKFPVGEAILPWTLASCMWTAAAFTVRTFLWCAERTGLVATAFCAGLAVNVGMNAALVPHYGLPGAVWATSAGTLTALTLILVFSHRAGMRIGYGMLTASALPLFLGLGAWVSLAVLVLLLAVSAGTNLYFCEAEKQRLLSTAERYWRVVHRRRTTGLLPSAANAAGVAPAETVNG